MFKMIFRLISDTGCFYCIEAAELLLSHRYSMLTLHEKKTVPFSAIHFLIVNIICMFISIFMLCRCFFMGLLAITKLIH